MKEKQLDLFDRPSAKQLWLLNYTNPLLSRLGKEFFSALPRNPGVYKMKNDRGEIIYVGKAKNLRTRLRSYTHVSSDNSSRKVLRLVYLIRSIEWEELDSEEAALLRENHLLRTLSPYFNVVNTAPHTYLFAHLRYEKTGIQVHFAMAPDQSYPNIYGAFKGLGLCYRTHKALLRLIWASYHECRNGFELPGILTNRRKLEHFILPLSESILPDNAGRHLFRKLKCFFNGTARTLLDHLVEQLLAREDLAAFTRVFIQNDLETLTEFYSRCAKRNRRIKRKFKLGDSLIPQEQIDDFLVKMTASSAE